MPRRKKTTEEKKASGSYRPGFDGHDDPPLGTLGRPETPKTLTEYQQNIFNETCEMLADADWLRISDGGTIEAYSVLMSRLRLTPDDFSAAEFTQLRLYLNELGLSPAARAKMPKVEKKEVKSEFDDL